MLLNGINSSLSTCITLNLSCILYLNWIWCQEQEINDALLLFHERAFKMLKVWYNAYDEIKENFGENPTTWQLECATIISGVIH